MNEAHLLSEGPSRERTKWGFGIGACSGGPMDATDGCATCAVQIRPIALGLGTMIGWKRIVVTVGEKIGKTHHTYGQGASAEIVAMFTIWAADNQGLPVSTTH